MAERVKMSFDQLVNYKPSSGGKYFNLKDGEEARVRFLYNDLQDIEAYIVHEFQNPYALIACARQDNQDASTCKWCASGNNRVRRVIFPIFNEDANEVQYWRRTAQFAQERVIPLLQEIAAQNKPLASQVYKIRRCGEGRDTTYTVVPTGQPDNKTKDDLGKVEDPYDLGLIKESDYDYDTTQQQAQQAQQQMNPAYGNNITPARRTTSFE